LNCLCCDSLLKASLKTKRLSLQTCSNCGTFEARHFIEVREVEPWHSVDVSPTFLKALGERRLIQAGQMIDHFKRALEDGLILDYGCGQGVFVKALVSRGFNAMGCDLSREVTGGIEASRFIALERPWDIPMGIDFGTVVLLDVLEHSPNAPQFLARLKARGARHILVKVPLAGGPVFLAAKGMSRLGSATLMEKLFLVGDVSPHRLYFTSRGLIRLFEKEGYRLVSRLSFAEIGKELPRRIRQIPPSWKSVSPLVSGVGFFAELLSPVWPDTAAFMFSRIP
jgi:SAM-dependent methyltransferase